jgi:hypothetical protein
MNLTSEVKGETCASVGAMRGGQERCPIISRCIQTSNICKPRIPDVVDIRTGVVDDYPPYPTKQCSIFWRQDLLRVRLGVGIMRFRIEIIRRAKTLRGKVL